MAFYPKLKYKTASVAPQNSTFACFCQKKNIHKIKKHEINTRQAIPHVAGQEPLESFRTDISS